MTETAAAPRKITVELLLGLSATLLSLCALVVAVFQTHIARQQQHAAVWPFLRVLPGRIDDRFLLLLENRGVGPAVVKRVELSHRGEVFAALPPLFNRALTGFTGARFFVLVREGDVIKAGEEVELYKLAGDSARADRLAALVDEESFVLRITYGDVYGNCWTANARGTVSPVACPP